MEIVGLFMAGWGSNNKYALLSAMRAVNQIISYDLPWNEGVFKPMKIVAREGSIVSARYPAPVGQGPIGLLLMQLCRWAGAEVITTDTMPDRLEMSRRLGASLALAVVAILAWLFFKGTPRLDLREADVQFLLPAPLPRRAVRRANATKRSR